MTIQAVIVWINAAVFTFYGIGFVVAPELLSQYVTGAIPASASGLIDMRSTYGGMSVAVGVLLFVISSKRGNIENGLIGVIVLMLCMASGRIYGIAVDGSANMLMYIYLAIEIGMAGISWWALAHSDEKKTLTSLFQGTAKIRAAPEQPIMCVIITHKANFLIKEFIWR